jgi:23S rRNA pseudouridine2605 synthase
MRLNRFVAQASGLSRRGADVAIDAGRVKVNAKPALIGQVVDEEADSVTLDGQKLDAKPLSTVLLHKPVGYIVSRDGQGSKTIYNLLPPELHDLKPVGRLDKDSSGLLLLTNDGKLAAELTHPSHQKEKVYEVELDRPLNELHRISIEKGIELEDGPSRLHLSPLETLNLELGTASWLVTMHEGRKRQIRRTFGELGYKVTRLHRVAFGPYHLESQEPGTYRPVKS